MVFEWRLPASLPGQLILSPELFSQAAHILNLFLATYSWRSIIRAFPCVLFFVLFSLCSFLRTAFRALFYRLKWGVRIVLRNVFVSDR